MTEKNNSKNLGKPIISGQRLSTAAEVLASIGKNPIAELARLAIKAENAGEYGVASSNWREIQRYAAPAFKAVDVYDSRSKQKQSATIDDLTEIKKALVDSLTPIDVTPKKNDDLNGII